MAKKKSDFMHDAGIAAAGAAVGAVVAGTAVAMTDPNIRKNVEKKIEGLEEKVEEGRDTLAGKVHEEVDKAKKAVADKTK